MGYLFEQITVRTPKGSVCRFFKPDQVQELATFVDDRFCMQLHRPLGCEYVNAYNPTVLATLKCNHDAQLVLNSDARDTAGYVCKYCMKKQNPVENETALSIAAFAKASNKARSLPEGTSTIDRGKRLLQSMLYTLTNGQEIAAPMAALHILRPSPFWFSHEIVRIDIEKAMVEHPSYEDVHIPIGNGTSRPRIFARRNTQLRKYWQRQPDLEDVPFITICEQYSECGDNRRNNVGANLTASTVAYSRATARKVIVICGRQLPDIFSNADQETCQFYYMAVLSLFKPHRCGTLLLPGRSARLSYQKFLQSGETDTVAEMRAFEIRLQDYYHGQDVDGPGQDSAETILLKTRRQATTPWIGNEMSDVDEDEVEDCDSEDPDLYDEMPSVALPSKSTALQLEESEAIVDKVEHLNGVISYVASTYPPVESPSRMAKLNVDEYLAHIADSNVHDDESSTTGTYQFVAQFPDAPTRLERLRDCFQPVPWSRIPTGTAFLPETLPRFPRIADVSHSFNLNFWQHAAFETLARHLLYAYSRDIEESLPEQLIPSGVAVEPFDVKDQLIAYLGGEAGTGKSTVVHALLAFASMWGREGTVETIAFTGVAAMNINGQTMHSARHLTLNSAEPKGAPTLEMKANYSRVVLVIMDELSMTDQALLGGVDASSRAMTNTPSKMMGGKHVLFLSDLMQLPPVGGTPCKCQELG